MMNGRKKNLIAFLMVLVFSSCLGSAGTRDVGPSIEPKVSLSPNASTGPLGDKPVKQKLSPSPSPDPSPEAPINYESDFYKANIGDFRQVSLANGISVHMKRNPASQMVAVKLIIRGNALLCPPGKAGLESLTLKTMGRGSKAWDYDKIRSLAYATSSSIAQAASQFDYSSFDLITYDKYLSRCFPAYADCFTDPGFRPEDYKVALNELRLARSQALADPYSFATMTLHDATFAGHPYANDPSGTEQSIGTLSLEDCVSYYQSIGAERLSVVATGGFDEEELIGLLEASFGKIKRGSQALPPQPKLGIKGDLNLAPFPKSPGIAYIRGDFAAPGAGEREYGAYCIADCILNDLLYDIVRTKYSACYTPQSAVFGFKSPYASIIIFKTSSPEKIRPYIKEAVNLLASGKTPNILRQAGSEYGDIEKTLDAYKAKYINAFYGRQESAQEIASQMAASLVYYDSPSAYLGLIDRLRLVKAADVVAVTKKYIQNGKISWVIVSDQASLDKVNPADWK